MSGSSCRPCMAPRRARMAAWPMSRRLLALCGEGGEAGPAAGELAAGASADAQPSPEAMARRPAQRDCAVSPNTEEPPLPPVRTPSPRVAPPELFRPALLPMTTLPSHRRRKESVSDDSGDTAVDAAADAPAAEALLPPSSRRITVGTDAPSHDELDEEDAAVAPTPVAAAARAREAAAAS